MPDSCDPPARGVADASRDDFTPPVPCEFAARQQLPAFLSSLSHELRAPLNVVTGFTELLIDGAFGPVHEGQHGALRDIMQAAEQMQRVLDHSVDIMRADAGQLTVQREVLSAEQMVRYALTAAQGLAMAQGVALRAQVAPRLAVWGDERWLQQVLSCLLNNALRYSSPATTVAVAVTPAGEYLRFAVTDKGCGIRPDDLPCIFNDFYCGDDGQGKARPTAAAVTHGEFAPISDGGAEGAAADGGYEGHEGHGGGGGAGVAECGGGAGLGLGLARRLVRLMGGELVCEQTSPGLGSTFAFTLPAATAPA